MPTVAGGAMQGSWSFGEVKQWPFVKRFRRGKTIVGHMPGQQLVHPMICILPIPVANCRDHNLLPSGITCARPASPRLTEAVASHFPAQYLSESETSKPYSKRCIHDAYHDQSFLIHIFLQQALRKK